MEKKPILGRLILVAIISAWAVLQWFPKPWVDDLGAEMVEVFKTKLRAGVEAESIIIVKQLELAQARNAAMRPPEELSLDDWIDAIGEDTDLRELILENFQREIFPGVLSKTGDDNLSEKDKKRIDRIKRRTLKGFGLSIDAWESPTPEPEQQKKINREILKRIEKEASGKIRLGLDLRGGVQFVAQVQPQDDPDEPGKKLGIDAQQLSTAIEIIRDRVDGFGVSEPLIQTGGDDLIIIQVPALSQSDREKVQVLIQTIGKLDFRLSHPNSQALVDANAPRVRGAELMKYEQEDPDGKKVVYAHYIQREIALSGSHIKSASVQRNPLTGVPEIHFTLDAIGASQFAKITERHQVGEGDPRMLAIVLDRKLVSAPSINGRIHSRGQITGDFTEDEANKIASSLNNPLKNPLKIIEMRDVDPSLGADSIKKGYQAAVWGLLAVAVFMLIYYVLSGVMANIALTLNIVILLGVLCWFDAALTLPGIAGVVLTIGMAVDANVLIYERIREELNVGNSLKGAISSGYDKAFGTIFDANITTMIASVILIYMGKGPVKGFGITLTIGILTSMFTALVVTRLVMDFLLNRGLIGSEKSKRFMHLRPTANLPKFDFLKYAKPAFIASWVLILFGFGFGMMKGTDKMLGVDFKGGYSLLMTLDAGHADQFNREIEDGTLRKKLAAETGIDGASFQFQLRRDKVKDEHKLQVNFPIAPEGQGDYDVLVKNALAKVYPEAGLTHDKLDKVGGTVSGEIQKSAVIAVFLAMFGILIYVAFRYEYSFAVGAVVAILHDVLMTGGWFFLGGGELNAPIVAAALTIIGFSINDTIVIFDRIRENLRMGTRGTFAEVMNTSLNQTLSRTIITSGTTLLSTATLYFFGGTVINDFAFAFLVGVIVGTYSSIYIACAIVLWWHKGKRPELSMGPLTTESAQATT
jgi:SecD/SecF fusion protein